MTLKYKSDKDKVYNFLMKNSGKPFSAKRISKLTGVRLGNVAKRISDLRNEATITTSVSRTGKYQYELVA